MNRLMLPLLASAVIGALAALPAQAQTPLTSQVASRSIEVPKDKSVTFRLDREVGELVIAQPGIAEIVAQTSQSFYVRGKTVGATNILVYDPSKRLIDVIDVRVGPDLGALRDDLAQSLPGETITVSRLADGVMLSGEVSTTAVAQRAAMLAERYAPKSASSIIKVRDSEQILLEVRIIEAGKSAMQDIGLGLNVNGPGFKFKSGSGLIGASPAQGGMTAAGTFGTYSVDASLDALEQKGVIHMLARPNLVAVSGQEASFLAGGEFPFPVPTGQNQVTIEFKPFGVTLKFKPEVLDNGLIRLKVEPEVSELDTRNSLRINGFDVPSLLVRKASTTVELHDGDSMAMAGLFQSNYANTARQLPGLGNLPVIGALFRSTQFQRQESELVIIVTPRRADVHAPLPNPLEATAEPTGIDLLMQRVVPGPSATPPLKLAAGNGVAK